MLKIYNTLSRQKEEFKPIIPGKISMYVCGVTIYDLCHIGHGRTFIIFDIINRYLRYLGYDLTYVRNITNIDDKIIKKALENNETCNTLTSRMLTEMYKDFDALNILRPDFEPKVTDHIQEIINLIIRLINFGNAYISNNGDVIFSIDSYLNYGLLSHQTIKQLKSTKSFKNKNFKHNPLDFVLWKMSKNNEPSWPSPWGNGRPGWHIECSAMNNKQLGNHFDIHGGGVDLIFPHHENEIAQSYSAYNNSSINYWIHTGMIVVNKEKMSKSSNNYFTIRDLLKRYDAETIRYFLLSGHYRSTLNYTETNLKQSRAALERLYTALRNINTENIKINHNKKFKIRFIKAMNDDFNTPKVYSILFDLVKEINRFKISNIKKASELAIQLKEIANILGLLTENTEKFLQNYSYFSSNITNTEEIKKLIKERNNARKNKLWKEADIIRNKLNKIGITLEDKYEETLWRINRNKK